MKVRARRILVLTFLSALLVAVNSCSLTRGKGAGESAVAQFHNQFNAELYHEIYAQTDEGFRKATNEDEMIALLEAVHKKLGAVKNASQIGWHVNATTAGTLVMLAYNTEFTGGRATEQFVFYTSGDKAKLFQYNINSPLLVTK